MGFSFSSLIEPVLTGGLSFLGSRGVNRANSAIAQRQMDFQREMSNTSYQRSMADMRAAGLNPILAYKTGGASTPSGASIPAQNEIEPAINSALAVRRQNADLQLTQAQTALTQNQSEIARRDAFIKGKQTDMLKWLLNKGTDSQNSNSAKSQPILPQSLPNLTPNSGLTNQQSETWFSSWMKNLRSQVFGK